MLGAGLFNRDGGSREADGNGYQFNGSLLVRQGDQRHLVVSAERRLLQLRPLLAPRGQRPARLPPARRSSRAARRRARAVAGRRADRRRHVPAGRGRQPGSLRERGHQPAEVRPALRPGVQERRPDDSTRAATTAPTGIVHTGIGPFRLESGSYMAYGRVAYNKGALRISAFGNFLDAEAPNLLVDRPRHARADHPGLQDPDLRLRDRQHERAGRASTSSPTAATCGRTTSTSRSRRATTAPSSAPTGSGSTSSTSSASRSAAASTSSATSSDPVFSPRVSVMFKPTPDHSIRASYNRAFVSPSFINNYLNQNIAVPRRRSTSRRSSR